MKNPNYNLQFTRTRDDLVKKLGTLSPEECPAEAVANAKAQLALVKDGGSLCKVHMHGKGVADGGGVFYQHLEIHVMQVDAADKE